MQHTASNPPPPRYWTPDILVSALRLAAGVQLEQDAFVLRRKSGLTARTAERLVCGVTPSKPSTKFSRKPVKLLKRDHLVLGGGNLQRLPPPPFFCYWKLAQMSDSILKAGEIAEDEERSLQRWRHSDGEPGQVSFP